MSAKVKKNYIKGINELLKEEPDIELIALVYDILWKTRANRMDKNNK